MRIRTITIMACLWPTIGFGAPGPASVVDDIATDCAADPRLEEVLTDTSLKVSYSERIITPRMRAIGHPPGAPAERLAAWLSVYGLGLVETAADRYLITRAENAQPVIAGRLLDPENRPLANADLRITGAQALYRSSVSGCFLLPPSAADAELQVVGFEPYRLLATQGWLRIQLNEKGETAIENVLVIGSSHQIMRSKLSPQNFLNREQIERFPHIGDDITRVFRHLPGVASGDISPKTNVRGGEKNELAMVVDGLELHQPWYFKSLDGLVSIVDSNIIASVDMLSGGYTADYGGKTSAVVDIKTLAPEEVRPTMGVSFLTAFGQTGGTFDRGGWFTSVRGGYLDLVFKLADADADVEPRYQDVFSKVEVDLNDSNVLSLNLLAASDSFRLDDGYQGEDREFVDDTSSNHNLWLRLATEFGKSLKASNALSLTMFEHRLWAYNDEPALVWQDRREYQGWGFRSDWSAVPFDNHMFKWGIDLKKLEADYDYYLAVLVLPDDHNSLHFVTTHQQAELHPRGEDRAAYAAYRFTLFDRLTTELGGRWSEQTYTGLDEDVAFSPRLNAVYELGDATRLNASWGRFRQPQAIDGLYPGDGDTKFYPSQIAEHEILGLRHTFSERWEARVDFYQKDYSRLIPRYENAYEDIGRTVDEATYDRIRTAPDSARARGVELAVNYDSQRVFSAWGNYSYSEVNDFVDGQEIPRLWDQRHIANISLNWERGEWHFNITGMFRSGWPTTPLVVDPRQRLDNNAARPDLDNYNTERLDGYSRIDLRLTKKKMLRNGDFFQYYFEIYNLLDAKNPCCTSYSIEPSDNSGDALVRPDFDDWLPRVPSFGVRYTF